MLKNLQDLNRLLAFVAVVDEGSVSAAAKRLFVTQPALTTRLRLLEESLSCVLLERTGKGVRPTQLGETVYKSAVEILRRVEHMNLAVKNQLELLDGSVHVTGGPHVLAGVLGDAVSSFRKQFPALRFTMIERRSKQVLQAVRAGAADLGVYAPRLVTTPEEEYELSEVTEHYPLIESFSLFVSHHHPLAEIGKKLQSHQRQLLPIHLSHQSFVMPLENTSIREVVDAEFREKFVHPTISATCSSIFGTQQLVEKHALIGVMSNLISLDTSKFIKLNVQNIRLQRKLVVISSRERTLHPAAQNFLQFLVQRLKEDVGEQK